MAAESATWTEYRLLGPLEVVSGGRAVPLGGTREREVLALLLLAPNRVVSAERLVEDLWAGRPPAGAMRALRVFVSRLRRSLRDAGLEGVLQTRTPGYLAAVDAAATDVARFEAALAEGRAASAEDRHAAAATGFAAALALWRGPALADVCGAPVARAEAARLEELRLGALEERVRADLACGRHAHLVAELEGLTRAHPLREEFWRARMLALYRCGRQADALRAYGELRDTLADELGLDPGTGLRTLEGAILRQDPALAWPPPGTLPPAPAVPPPTVQVLTAPQINDDTEVLGEGPLTILFTDVEGSTELRARHGDHEAQHLLSAHEEIVRAQITAHRGREVKSLGDGFMVAFVSVRRAVACAVAIQRALAGPPGQPPAVSVRIGLNTGEVLREGDDLYGQAVHAAARIAGRAAGGQILVSELVRQLAGSAPGITFTDQGRQRLKGFSERWRLFEVVWDDEAAPRFAPRTPYVGRVAERDELGRLLADALVGRGAVAMIGGEAGVGKTRLAQELLADATRRGARTRVGRCYETEGAPPYVPFVEMLEQALEASPSPQAFRELLGEHAPEVARLLPRLRRLFPDLPPPLELPPEQERRYLFNSVVDVLARAAARAPMVLVLDDLHWADEPTLLLLDHLAGRVEGLPVLVVGTYRDNEVDSRPALARTLDGLLRRGLATRLSLRRFAGEDVGALLAALSGRRPPPQLIDLIHRQTDGNPFFVEEVYKHLAEEGRLFDAEGAFRTGLGGELDVPETLRLVLGRRLDHLSPAGRRALEAAAVTGRAFTYELLDAMGELAADELLDALDEADHARLVTPLSPDSRDARLLFSHELIRQTILAGLSRPRRQRLHLRAAVALQAAPGDTDQRASEIADHLNRAGPAVEPAELLRWLVRAGRHALATAGFEDALRHFEQALTLRQFTDAAGSVQLLVDVALARRSLGRLQDAHEMWLQAIDAYEALGDAEATARACSEAAQDLLWCNRDQEAWDLALRGLATLGDAAPALRARMVGWAAGTGGWSAPYELVDAMSREAIELAEALDDPQLLGEVLMNDASLRFAFYQQVRAAESGRRAADLLKAAGDPWNTAMARAWANSGLVELGRFGEALEGRAETRELALRLGNFAAVWCDNWAEAAWTLASPAGLDAFEANAREALEMSAGLNFESIALPRLGMAAFFRGDWDAALEHCREGARHELTNRLRGTAFGPLVQVLAYRGDRAEALALLAAENATMPVPGVPNAYGSWILLGHAVEALAVLGERGACAALYPAAAEFASSGVVLTVFQGRLTQRVAGTAAAAGGDWAAAERHFEAALRQADDLPHRLEYAETRRFYARMLLDRAAPGDADRAAALLAEADTRYAGLGMPRHADLARPNPPTSADFRGSFPPG